MPPSKPVTCPAVSETGCTSWQAVNVTLQPAPPALARRPAIAAAVVAGLVLVLLAWLLVPWSWVPGGTLSPLSPRAVFSVDEIARAEAYSSLRRVLALSSMGVSLLTAMVLGFTPWGSRLARRLTRGLRWWLSVPVIVVAVLLVGRLFTLPLALASREHNLAYGLTRQALSGWAADYVKSFMFDVVVSTALLLLLIGLARWTPRWWFAWAGVGMALLVFAGSFAYPVVVEPAFNRYMSMSDGPLKQSILSIAEREDVEIDEVLVADASRRTTTLNAYVSGIGKTSRVVVYDNLLEDLPPRQVLSVVAHELAHARHRDVLLGTTLGAIGGFLGVCVLALAIDSSRVRRRAGFSGPGDPASAPFVLAMVVVGTLLVSPFENVISRTVELRADRDALRFTSDPQAFLAVQHQLAVRSLADPTPPVLTQFWFGSHPTTLQRSGLPSSLERAGR